MGGQIATPVRKTVASFDLDRFIGESESWYEVSHIPNKYQKECKSTAITIRKDARGVITYSMTCYNEGPKGSNRGVLTVPDPDSPAKMHLEMKWGLFARSSGEFWVYDTDYDNFALIGTPAGYFWVLSRKPKMSFCKLKDVFDKATELGFDRSSARIDFESLSKCYKSEAIADR